MFPIIGDSGSNSNSIIKQFRNNNSSSSLIHEHDFISIKTEKQRKSIICLTCSSVYCERFGKLLLLETIHDKKNYMQRNLYN